MSRGAARSRRGALLSVSVLSGVVLLVGVQAAADRFFSSPAFRVEEVHVEWMESGITMPSRFRLRPATSVFRVDLESLDRAFQMRYPGLEVQEIRRKLPNLLIARVRPRAPVAQVRVEGTYHTLSETGVVISTGQRTLSDTLPELRLKGLRGPLRPGQRVPSEDFWKAHPLLGAIRRDGGVAGQRVRAVEVMGSHVLVTLGTGVELRFQTERLEEGWRRLGDLIAQRPGILAQARYVDLRFENPAFKRWRSR